jgi:hypothetical protein
MYDKRALHTSMCEICDKQPASQMQGGLVKGKRKFWFCCKACQKQIIDERKSINDPRYKDS